MLLLIVLLTFFLLFYYIYFFSASVLIMRFGTLSEDAHSNSVSYGITMKT